MRKNLNELAKRVILIILCLVSYKKVYSGTTYYEYDYEDFNYGIEVGVSPTLSRSIKLFGEYRCADQIGLELGLSFLFLKEMLLPPHEIIKQEIDSVSGFLLYYKVLSIPFLVKFHSSKDGRWSYGLGLRTDFLLSAKGSLPSKKPFFITESESYLPNLEEKVDSLNIELLESCYSSLDTSAITSKRLNPLKVNFILQLCYRINSVFLLAIEDSFSFTKPFLKRSCEKDIYDISILNFLNNVELKLNFNILRAFSRVRGIKNNSYGKKFSTILDNYPKLPNIYKDTKVKFGLNFATDFLFTGWAKDIGFFFEIRGSERTACKVMLEYISRNYIKYNKKNYMDSTALGEEGKAFSYNSQGSELMIINHDMCSFCFLLKKYFSRKQFAFLFGPRFSFLNNIKFSNEFYCCNDVKDNFNTKIIKYSINRLKAGKDRINKNLFEHDDNHDSKITSNVVKFQFGLIFGFDYETNIGLIWGMQIEKNFGDLIKFKDKTFDEKISDFLITCHIGYNFSHVLGVI